MILQIIQFIIVVSFLEGDKGFLCNPCDYTVLFHVLFFSALLDHCFLSFSDTLTPLHQTYHSLKSHRTQPRVPETYPSPPTMAHFSLLVILLSLFLAGVKSVVEEERKTYIVHLAKHEIPAVYKGLHLDWYQTSLQSVSESAEILYAYDTVAHGFSTRMTPSEAEALLAVNGVLQVTPETRYHLHTTRTPEFLGLMGEEERDYFLQSNKKADVVVGVLDTGVWPELKSYDDEGFGPVPSTWKGICQVSKGFNASSCNRKLIGASFFSKGYEASMGMIDNSKEERSPRDVDGHGSHTSTTAAGSLVPGASLFGFAPGTARGMAPRARVAVYKVCWTGGCFSSDILAALDKAVNDGVNVLSLSLGGGQSDYYKDTVAVGSFAAIEKGIFVSCSAGNAGPAPGSMSNVAPWIATVGAGTIDRDFPVFIVLGNGKNYSGSSLYSGKKLVDTPKYDFIYAGNATNATNGNLCMAGTLIPEKVAGKIVLCDRGISARVKKGQVVKDAGGIGMVLANSVKNGEELVGDAHLLPGAAVGAKTGDLIKAYIFSVPNPKATIIFRGTEVGISPSPVVAAFSSRGPNVITSGILKPDLIAPGVNILAGWSGVMGPTGLSTDTRRTPFNIISGTSMSCPHVSGLAALLKSAHPDWSPAAIKSALMTTAYNTYKSGTRILAVDTGKTATPYDIGSGHAHPIRAMNPGLIYDMGVEDYLNFLCALNYTELQITAMSRRNFTCSNKKTYSVSDLNYPSFTVEFPKTGGNVKQMRTVTNVESTGGTYKAAVTGLKGKVNVVVEPSELKFVKVGEKKSYTVSFTVTGNEKTSGSTSFGRLEWSDGNHVVGSPISLTWA